MQPIKFGSTAPRFGAAPVSFVVPAPVLDPLRNVPETGDPEVDGRAEMDAVRQAWRDQHARQRAAAESATGADECWLALVFQTAEQKEEFLSHSGLVADNERYLDGRLMAKLLGIELATGKQMVRRKRYRNESIPQLEVIEGYGKTNSQESESEEREREERRP